MDKQPWHSICFAVATSLSNHLWNLYPIKIISKIYFTPITCTADKQTFFLYKQKRELEKFFNFVDRYCMCVMHMYTEMSDKWELFCKMK